MAIIRAEISYRYGGLKVQSFSYPESISISQSRRPIFSLVAEGVIILEVIHRRHQICADKVTGEAVDYVIFLEPISRFYADLPHLECIFVIVRTTCPPREYIFNCNRPSLSYRNLKFKIHGCNGVIKQIGLERADGPDFLNRGDWRK